MNDFCVGKIQQLNEQLEQLKKSRRERGSNCRPCYCPACSSTGADQQIQHAQELMKEKIEGERGGLGDFNQGGGQNWSQQDWNQQQQQQQQQKLQQGNWQQQYGQFGQQQKPQQYGQQQQYGRQQPPQQEVITPYVTAMVTFVK